MKHLACIMDGNRRWAKARNLPPWQGHHEGLKAAERAVEFCLHNSISVLSLYVFSVENFKRSSQELDFLFGPVLDAACQQLDAYRAQGVQVRLVGDPALFPVQVRNKQQELEYFEGTPQLIVYLLLAYGGQQEIVAVMQRVACAVQAGTLNPAAIHADTFFRYSWLGPVAPPDLIIRTGGAKRLSNFFLYQSAYSELCFLDCMWPDLQIHDLTVALQAFNSAQRNFGK
jgi:undecaprenyl diphosphate synthase